MKPKRKENLDFHVQADDTFVTMGTVLYFLEEELGRAEEGLEKAVKKLTDAQKFTRKTLSQTKEDLLYLQKYFRITKRNEKQELRIKD